MSSFWSWWVIALTAASFAAVTWLLFANRTGPPASPEQTTGHAADGIEEYDNPMPYWWFLMFVITIAFGAGYLLVYPGMGNFPGLLGWSQTEQWQRAVAAADDRFQAQRLRYLAMPLDEVAADPRARKMGQRMFANNCAQCHGADARGSRGFPNLADDDWLWGGSPAAIKTSIGRGRVAAMPAWGPLLGEEGVRDVTAYLQGLNGRAVEPARAAAGKAHYDMVCAACHGPQAKGNPLFGAPDLSNGIWLYGGSDAQVAHSIRAGRSGVMPAHDALLSEDKIHLIAAYVLGLER